MPQTIAATYEHGVFVPRVPVNLPEHTEVKLFLPKIATKRYPLTAMEQKFLALCGITRALAGKDSVELQKEIRNEWRGL